ncbi:F-box/LRR-repeat protein, partial [Trifolium medium]|nr:F-box/LRR-repeat protein [Trifolium medium]
VDLTDHYYIYDEQLFHLFKNCKLLEEAILFDCYGITNDGIASALRERPTLKSLCFSDMLDPATYVTSNFSDSLASLKSLTSLDLLSFNISNELLSSIAITGLPLRRLVLQDCMGYSYAGIFCLLSKCQHIQHLDLQNADFLKDQHVAELSTFLGDLLSINVSCCHKLTQSTLFALTRNCPSLSEIKIERIGSEIVEKFDSLIDFGVYPQLKSLYLARNLWLSDESIIMFASTFPNLQLLDLKSCKSISEEEWTLEFPNWRC